MKFFITAHIFILYFRLRQCCLYQLNRELARLRRRSGAFGGQKTLLLPPEFEPRFLGRPARGLVTTLTPPRFSGTVLLLQGSGFDT